jgi:SAM-dependent methyltransferase
LSPSDPPRKPETATANEADIADAYRLVLKREPDPEGWAHYSERARLGMTIDELVAALLSSDERRTLVERRATVQSSDDAPSERDEPSDLIDPAQVAARYTVEELNATAEEYYRRIDDPTPLMVKPFAFLNEAPAMLQSLGLLLGGLHLGKTMTVLDFGAGTCWLSRFLAQLNCQPICCDVSHTALAIGRRLFAESPLLGTAVYQPVFLPFDGHKIDLPHSSVDRIVSFDAFHHVPNQEEILSEFGRVLRDGGVVGFSEPGYAHSRSPQAQYEMRLHNVLENDIRLDEILERARQFGFTDVNVKLESDVTVNLDGYRALIGKRRDEGLAAQLWTNTRDVMMTRSVFFLHKGPLRQDSRHHVGLQHELDITPKTSRVRHGEPVSVDVRLRNTGTASWLATNTEIFGTVRLGTHLLDGSGTLLSVDHSRHSLPERIEPGGTASMTVHVGLPRPGHFRLAFDLVAEGVTWFENQGSHPVEVNVLVE